MLFLPSPSSSRNIAYGNNHFSSPNRELFFCLISSLPCSRIGGFYFTHGTPQSVGMLLFTPPGSALTHIRCDRIPASVSSVLVTLLGAGNYLLSPLPPVAFLFKRTSPFYRNRSSSCAVSVSPKLTLTEPYLTLYSILRWRVPLPASA